MSGTVLEAGGTTVHETNVGLSFMLNVFEKQKWVIPLIRQMLLLSFLESLCQVVFPGASGGWLSWSQGSVVVSEQKRKG